MVAIPTSRSTVRRFLHTAGSLAATLVLVSAVLFAGLFLAGLHGQLTYTEADAQFEATGIPSSDPSVAVTYSGEADTAPSKFSVTVSNATSSLNGTYDWHRFTANAAEANSTLTAGDSILITPEALTDTPTAEDDRAFQNATITIQWSHDSTITTVSEFPDATSNSTV